MPLIDYAGAQGDAYHRQRHAEFYESPMLAEARSVGHTNHYLYSGTRRTICNLLNDCGYAVESAKLNWRNGRRLFLPLYRMFGAGAYAAALKTLGWLRRYGETVVVARAK